MKALLVAILLLITAACASVDPSWMYVKPETDAFTRRADFSACHEQTQAWALLAWPAPPAAAHACMTARGYTQEPWSR